MKSFSTVALIALATTAVSAAYTENQLTCAASELDNCSGVTDFTDSSCACDDTFVQAVKVCLYQGGFSTDVSTWFTEIAATCAESNSTTTAGSSSSAAAAVGSASSTVVAASTAASSSVAASAGASSVVAAGSAAVSSAAAESTASPTSGASAVVGSGVGVGLAAVGALACALF